MFVLKSIDSGCRFVNRLSRLEFQDRLDMLLNSSSNDIVDREKARHEQFSRHMQHRDAVSKWRHALHLAVRWSRSHYKDNIHMSEKEHMSPVDCFDGSAFRKSYIAPDQKKAEVHDTSTDDLLVIHPVVDGRLRDEGRP